MKEKIDGPYYVYVWLNDDGLVYYIGKGKRGNRTHHRPKKSGNPVMPLSPKNRVIHSSYPTEQLALDACKKLYGHLIHDCGLEQMEVLAKETWFDGYEFSSLARNRVDDMRSKNKKRVEAFKDGDSVGIYESIGDAAMELGIGKTNIINQLKGKQKTAGKHTFIYK